MSLPNSVIINAKAAVQYFSANPKNKNISAIQGKFDLSLVRRALKEAGYKNVIFTEDSEPIISQNKDALIDALEILESKKANFISFENYAPFIEINSPIV